MLLTPTTAVPAFPAEGPPPGGAMATPFTMLANLCWNPSISVPAGLTPDGLPVGLQITVPRHRDDLALRLPGSSSRPNPGPATPLNAESLTSVRAERRRRRRLNSPQAIAGLLLSEEALDLFGDGLGAGDGAGGLVVALLEAGRRRWRSPRRRRPARSPGARRTPPRSRGRWWAPRSGASPTARSISASAAFGDGRAGHVGGHGGPQRRRAEAGAGARRRGARRRSRWGPRSATAGGRGRRRRRARRPCRRPAWAACGAPRPAARRG